MAELKALELATMLPGFEPIDEPSANPVWKGPLKLEDGSEISAFVKVLCDRDLFVECACAVLGSKLGLPIPRPFIVRPDDKAIELSNEPVGALAFGSEDKTHPSFYQLINADGTDGDWHILETGGISVRTGLFDEWIANADRNLGNILYGGSDQYFLIDHANALPDWISFDAGAQNNLVVEKIYKHKSEKEKYKFLEACTKQLKEYPNLDLGILKSDIKTGLLPDADITAIVDFLSLRTAEIVVGLLKSRIDLEQSEFNL